MHEELDELAPRAAAESGNQDEVEDELGDLLFVLVNVARFLKVDPEQALRKTNAKFRHRFGYVERKLRERGKQPRRVRYRRDGSAVAGGQAGTVIDDSAADRPTGEFEAAVQIQKEIWGFDDIELLPVRLFVVATKVGGQVFGAFDGGRMVGFLLAIPGIKADGRRLSAQPHARCPWPNISDRGLGRMLKLEQRREALARGIDLVEWTFDPLELKNAFFNMERLGAVCAGYVLNQYGTTSSHLHGGLPTDRWQRNGIGESPGPKRSRTGSRCQRPLIEERIERSRGYR